LPAAEQKSPEIYATKSNRCAERSIAAKEPSGQ
jgi:hypothetical protein